jgi:hypothetical protein
VLVLELLLAIDKLKPDYDDEYEHEYALKTG